jgi:hypothetical protein
VAGAGAEVVQAVLGAAVAAAVAAAGEVAILGRV